VEFSTFLRRTGANIRKARWLARMTQEEVAGRGGITYRHYQELERGKVNPTLRTLFELARLLGRPVAELVDVEPPSTKPKVPLSETKAEPPRRGRKSRAPVPSRR
jgi:transcriptional regulator with XRE-family HTH domain